MRRSGCVPFLLAVLLLLSGAIAAASARPLELPRGPGLEEQVDRLGLDAETRARVQKVLDASRAEQAKIRVALREAQEELRRLLAQEQPDEAEVMNQADAIGALETQARKQSLRSMLRVRALLTPEQRRRFMDSMRAVHSPKPRGTPPALR